jgi:hypothetical protein
MDYTLKRDIFDYFKSKENPTDKEKLLLRRTKSELDYFDVTSVCRDDVFSQCPNIDVAKIDDCSMEYIANKLGDSLMDDYWISLDVIVEANKDYLLSGNSD